MDPVRRATTADAHLVARMLHDFNTEFESPTPPVDVLARRYAALLARDDVLVLLVDAEGEGGGQEAVGFAYLTLRPTPYHDGPLAQLEELYVRPRLRDQGLGTALMARILGELRDRRAGEVHINVDEVDVDTRRFYERHGFVNVEPGADYRMLCYLREL
ncbi:GNAT family N-acetyltransferase [Nocardioides solisilvae]|uniref:GNAT family N-acetyltransferase n=1 Tax=Nocardioides solisilvae TaxID=1542435 RepID=UPI000D7440A7|nr:GNAT family N-acetyltransferase [Nocardioides solisilvae]